MGRVYSFDNETMPSPLSPSLPPHALLIPWAVSLSDTCAEALPRLDEPGRLPHLQRLLSRLTQQAWLHGDEYQPATPHERFLAQVWGWPGAPQDEGPHTHWPFAAAQARQDGLPVAEGQAWGLLSPGHWLMGRDHLTLLAPDDLALEADESRAFFDAVRPLFESEGWQLHWGAPARWYAQHDTLAQVPTVSLDRVVGRNPDLWMPNHAQARLIRRLQSEVQMLLYQHPLNEQREQRGLLTVNSFWLSGAGRALPPAHDTPLQVFEGPRQALLRDNLPGWLDAWSALDATALRGACQAMDEGRPVQLTLCGERHALTLSPPDTTPSFWHRLRQRWRPSAIQPSSVLAQL